MKNGMRQRQRGMTVIGMLCIVAMAGVLVYAGIRLVPVYLNYMNIVRAMQATASEYKGETSDPGALRASLERHWEIETISAVDYTDIEITRDDSGISLHVAYDDAVPYFGNLSLAAHFDKTVKVK
jgi:hypothetical protein